MLTTLRIDPEFQALIPPMRDDELAFLEASLEAEGCRDALMVWTPDEGDGVPILLDGHNRYAWCQRTDQPFRLIEATEIHDRESAKLWIIQNQLGRRNLTAEQASYLRGKRYEMERARHGGDRRSEDDSSSENHNLVFQPNGEIPENSEGLVVPQPIDNLKTHERLAKEYHVSPSTITSDAKFSDAVDTLEQQVRHDLREAILKRKAREEKSHTTKQQVVSAGKAIQEKRVEPLPFMRRAEWKEYQVIEAIDLLSVASIALEEQAQINTLLDQPYIPAYEGLNVIRNLTRMPPAQRQHIYALQASHDPRDKSLSLTLAAKKAPEPDPQVMLARQLSDLIGDVRRRQRHWVQKYPHEPWVDELSQIDQTLGHLQGQYQAIASSAETAHQQRMTRYAETIETA